MELKPSWWTTKQHCVHRFILSIMCQHMQLNYWLTLILHLDPLHVVKHCYMKSRFEILEKREIYILHPISSPVSKFSSHADLWINSQTQWLQRNGNLGFTITGNNLFTLQWRTCSVSLFPHRHPFLSCN